MQTKKSSNNIEDNLTIATANILFGGMPLKYKSETEISVRDWLLTHFRLLVLHSESFLTSRHNVDGEESKTTNIAQKIVEEFDPDIFILNEVIPAVSSKEIDFLKKKSYQITTSIVERKNPTLNHTSVIATKFKGQQINIDWKLKGGGGVCAFRSDEKKLLVVAPHPTAFKEKVREKQLRFLAEFLLIFKTENPDYSIVLGGDFNTEGTNVDEYFTKLNFQRLSEKSFPNDALWNRLDEKKFFWLKHIMHLMEGQRDLDHILIPRAWKVKDVKSVETSSDHKALIVKVSG